MEFPKGGNRFAVDCGKEDNCTIYQLNLPFTTVFIKYYCPRMIAMYTMIKHSLDDCVLDAL